MVKQAPTLGRILVHGDLHAARLTAAGPWSGVRRPGVAEAHGYRFNASFAEATQLAQEADVRISGVNVGKVKKIDLSEDGRTDAEIELDDKYAPIPQDSRAILRQKTLLGETYIELTPGSTTASDIPRAGAS